MSNNDVADLNNTLHCPYCKKECSSKSGLTLHMKTCNHKPREENKVTDIDPHISIEEFEIDDSSENFGNMQNYNQTTPRQFVPNKITPKPIESHRPYDPPKKPKTTPKQPPKQNKHNPFNMGAFMLFTNHIPMMLDIEFAITLSDFILEHGSNNSALMAFAHQLNSLSGDEEE